MHLLRDMRNPALCRRMRFPSRINWRCTRWSRTPPGRIYRQSRTEDHSRCIDPFGMHQVTLRAGGFLNKQTPLTMTNWRDNIITDTAQIRELLAETKTIAVLGIKTEAQANQPAFYVPSYLQSAGFEIIPVPVYYPQVTHILGKEVYRRLIDIPIEVD